VDACRVFGLKEPLCRTLELLPLAPSCTLWLTRAAVTAATAAAALDLHADYETWCGAAMLDATYESTKRPMQGQKSNAFEEKPQQIRSVGQTSRQLRQAPSIQPAHRVKRYLIMQLVALAHRFLAW
jgi:hypothetical protein